jgi:hypothetical protein
LEESHAPTKNQPSHGEVGSAFEERPFHLFDSPIARGLSGAVAGAITVLHTFNANPVTGHYGNGTEPLSLIV